MRYFSEEFIMFFENLNKNNNKEWFDENRKVFENEVKKPFASFIDVMIHRIQEFEPEIKLNPGDAVFRINNDIRFKKDKTPYKVHAGGIISMYGRKDKSYPGTYLQFSFDKVMVYGGVYMGDNNIIQKIRENIAENLTDFQAIYNDKNFKKHFGCIMGEKNKRLPGNLQVLIEKEPSIANKQFYFGAELDSKVILKSDLPDVIMKYYQAGFKLNAFLKKAFV